MNGSQDDRQIVTHLETTNTCMNNSFQMISRVIIKIHKPNSDMNVKHTSTLQLIMRFGDPSELKAIEKVGL